MKMYIVNAVDLNLLGDLYSIFRFVEQPSLHSCFMVYVTSKTLTKALEVLNKKYGVQPNQSLPFASFESGHTVK